MDALSALRAQRQAFKQKLEKSENAPSTSAVVPSVPEVVKPVKENVKEPTGFDRLEGVRRAAVRCLVDSKLVLPIDCESLTRKIKRQKRKQPGLAVVSMLGTEEFKSLFHSVIMELADRNCIEISSDPENPIVTAVYPSKIAAIHSDLIEEEAAEKPEGEPTSPLLVSATEPDKLLPPPSPTIASFSSSSSCASTSSSTPSTPSFPNALLPLPPPLLEAPRGLLPVSSATLATPFSPPVKKSELSDLINSKTVKERELSAVGKEIEALIREPTAKEKLLAERFKTKGGSAVRPFCEHGTKEQCRLVHGGSFCDKVHFRRLKLPHTDLRQGDCSYLNACRHMNTCKFVHYEIDDIPDKLGDEGDQSASYQGYAAKYGCQWINIDVRELLNAEAPNILGHFSVVMADPPWNIHMELPYGTMQDEEMLALGMQQLQTDGVILLWVTNRAMELGRDCLDKWGYECVGEILWIKTNQLQRLIRTGRTGHWLNHSKEHCLIGVKGNPKINHNIDCDVIVAEVRETSRKPDELYNMLERLSPGTRKLEIFGRPHNQRPGWITLGNQTDGVRLTDEVLIERFKERYPDVPVNQQAYVINDPLKPTPYEGAEHAWMGR